MYLMNKTNVGFDFIVAGGCVCHITVPAYNGLVGIKNRANVRSVRAGILLVFFPTNTLETSMVPDI